MTRMTSGVNASSRLIVESVCLAQDKGLVAPVLVDNPSVIQRTCDEIAWDIADIPLESAESEVQSADITVALARRGRRCRSYERRRAHRNADASGA